jgi:trk system potassium uptake protein trkH
MLYRFIPVIYNLARLNILFSCLLWAPAVVSYYYDDGMIKIWLQTFCIMIFLSFLLWKGTQRLTRELTNKDGFLLATLLWVMFAFAAAIPFYFSHHIHVSFTNAYFEAISGLTTTGSSIFSNVEHLERSLNFWRHLLNWLGGIGIIVLAVAILPTLGIGGGASIIRAEVSGVYKDKKLTPRIKQTAKSLWLIYTVYTVMIIIALKLAGMNFFDAICHAFSSISLGGFSTYSDSIGHFHSLAIELVLIVAMLVGTMNFVTHIRAWQTKRLSTYWHDKEVVVSLSLLFLAVLTSTCYFYYYDERYGQGMQGFLETLRYVGFNYVAVMSTCGLSSTDFSTWPLYVAILIYVLINVIANAGSTGGGLKTIRFIIQCKFLYRELFMIIHPKAVKTVKVNKEVVSTQIALNVMAFVLTYLLSALLITLLFIFTGKDALSSFSFTIASLTNSGPGIGMLGPMADLNTSLSFLQKWIAIFAMLIGRLELFTIFILFFPAYWKI